MINKHDKFIISINSPNHKLWDKIVDPILSSLPCLSNKTLIDLV